MSLIACRECGLQVSESADMCPHCGVATPSAQRLATKRTAFGGCFLIYMLVPVLLIAYCTSQLTNATSGKTTRTTSPTDQNFERVAAMLEAEPGVHVERDHLDPHRIRIRIDRLVVSRDQALQLASTARSRLGYDAQVLVYDSSGRMLARATYSDVDTIW